MKQAFGEFIMTTRVRFSLPYDPLKWDFIAFKTSIISIENTLLTQTVSMALRVGAKVFLHVSSCNFYDTALSTEQQRHHMVNISIKFDRRYFMLAI